MICEWDGCKNVVDPRTESLAGWLHVRPVDDADPEFGSTFCCWACVAKHAVKVVMASRMRLNEADLRLAAEMTAKFIAERDEEEEK